MVRRYVFVAFALAVTAAAAWTFLPLGVTHTSTTSAFPGGGAEPVTTIRASRAWDSPRILLIIWVPVLVAAAPLLRGSHRFEAAATVIAAVLLGMFVVVAGFSIGLLYAPAAVVMSIAAVRARTDALDEQGDGEARELVDIRDRFAQSDMTGDAEFFEVLLTDDAVIMAPGSPAFEGKAACMEFIRGVFLDVNREFDRYISLTSAEVQLNGDWAFDRGTFSQRLVRREDGFELREDGKYFWLYRLTAGSWKLARIVGNYDWRDEE